MRILRAFRFAALIISVLIILNSLCLRGLSAAASLSERISGTKESTNPENARLSISCTAYDDIVEVTLRLDSNTGICGLFARLCFDPDAFILLSCGVSEDMKDSFNFNFTRTHGGVVFLIDSYENCSPNVRLARFYFKKTTAGSGEFDFRIVPASDRACYYIGKSNELCPIDIDVSKCQASIKLESIFLHEPYIARPYIWSIRADFGGKTVKLTVLGRVDGNDHFAVGFRIFTVYLDGASTESITVSRLGCIQEYEFCVDIDRQKASCIIITPMIYRGKQLIEGEKHSVVLY